MAVEDEKEKAALLSRLQQHDQFFCGMVNLVPAELYLRREDDEGKDANAKYFKNKRLAAPKQVKKEESKRGKKVKFDPANMKSVTELQKERAEKEKQDKAQRRQEKEKDEKEDKEEEEEDSENDEDMEEEDDDDEVEEGEDEDEDDDDDEDEEEEPAKAPSSKGGSNGNSTSRSTNGSQGEAKKPPAVARGPLSLVGTTPRAKSIEELKERLRLKIEEARAKRGGVSEGGNRRSAKDQREQQKNQPKKKGPPQTHNTTKPTSAASSSSPAAGVLSPPTPTLARKPSEQALDLQFSKISVPANMASGPLKLKGGKNLVGLLKKAEEKERRLKELQQTEEGKEEANALLWRDALTSAHGKKVLDNPKLLKKAIKKKQKQKEKSARKWGDRTAKLHAEEKEKQGKREANLKKRKNGGEEEKKDGEAPKKQRRAGFEGKRHGMDFLNREKEGGSGPGAKAGGGGGGKGGAAAAGGPGPIKPPRGGK